MLRNVWIAILIFAGAALLATTGCATTFQNPNIPNLISEREYYSTVQKYTAEEKIYSGLYNTMQFSATLMNSQVTRAQVDHKARIYQWSTDTYANERSAAETEMSKETNVFLSFFVPERAHDDFHKAQTKWKVFLDAGGKRYEGKGTKIKGALVEIQNLFPEHNRWSTPYKLTFPVPVSMIENQEAKLTITGPVGATTVTFKP